jgi:hypothetical protein
MVRHRYKVHSVGPSLVGLRSAMKINRAMFLQGSRQSKGQSACTVMYSCNATVTLRKNFAKNRYFIQAMLHLNMSTGPFMAININRGYPRTRWKDQFLDQKWWYGLFKLNQHPIPSNTEVHSEVRVRTYPMLLKHTHFKATNNEDIQNSPLTSHFVLLSRRMLALSCYTRLQELWAVFSINPRGYDWALSSGTAAAVSAALRSRQTANRTHVTWLSTAAFCFKLRAAAKI